MEKLTYNELERVILSKDDKFYMINGNYAPRSHYKFEMTLGRVWPCCKSQVQEWKRQGCPLDVMDWADIQRCENLMSKYCHKGEYQLTRSKRWARLVNVKDLLSAFELEFAK